MSGLLHRWVFSFRVEPSTGSYGICWCLLWCLVSTLRFPCGCHVHQWGLKHWGLHHCNSLVYTHGWHVSSGDATHSAVCQPSHQYVGPNSVGGSSELPWFLHLMHGGEGSSFPCCVPPSDLLDSKSVVGIKPGDSGVEIGIWLINFSHLVSGTLLCSITHLSWFHGQDVNSNPLPTWARVWGLFLFWSSSQRLWTWSCFYPHRLVSTHQNWIQPLMRLIPCHFQSLSISTLGYYHLWQI